MKRPRRNTATSNTYRFFVPPESLHGDEVLVHDEELARQLSGVLRLGPGDSVVLLDDSGWQYTVELTTIGRREVAGRVVARALAGGEPATSLAIYQALLRAERFEWVLQKATEIGASRIVPVACERSLAAADDLGPRKLDRWRRVAREAAEQCRRARLPAVAPPLAFADACREAAANDLAFLLWEGEAPSLRATLRTRLAAGPVRSVALLSGPEGGLTDHEVEQAQALGLTPVSLGPRTLRAETAPLVAAAALLYDLADLD